MLTCKREEAMQRLILRRRHQKELQSLVYDAQFVDLLFLLDVTASMNKLIEAVKKSVGEVIQLVQRQNKDCKV